MGFQAVRGTTDLLAEELARWSRVEHAAKRVARLYGYQEIRTPIIEDTGLFLRSVGETSDIVQKEMFRFDDRGGHELVLRPEGTASIVRAYLEHSLHKIQGFAKLFYLGPMFRAERPQAGRFRQFHQYGVEAIGSHSPWIDVEVIVLCCHILRECCVTDVAVWLSSMGCRADQERSAKQLRERLAPDKAKLCKECLARMEKNVFRVLDCKHPTCHEVAWTHIQGSPFLLCEDCQRHFDAVRQGLKDAAIPFDDTKVFARGLDYYTRTVFEVRAKGLGAKDAVAAGGRYDHLVEEFGGPSVGAVGFAAGIERILMATEPGYPAKLGGRGSPVGAAGGTTTAPRHGLYLAIAQPTLIQEGFRLVQQLRERGVHAVMDYDGRSLKSQLREADKANYRFVVVLGERELQQRSLAIKDLTQGDERTVTFDQFIDEVGQALKSRGHCNS